MSETKNLWGGRFREVADAGFAAFNRSFGFDRRLFAADVRASLAHAEGLRAGRVLTDEEARQITDGLQTMLMRARVEADYFEQLEAAGQPRLPAGWEKLATLIGRVAREAPAK